MVGFTHCSQASLLIGLSLWIIEMLICQWVLCSDLKCSSLQSLITAVAMKLSEWLKFIHQRQHENPHQQVKRSNRWITFSNRNVKEWFQNVPVTFTIQFKHFTVYYTTPSITHNTQLCRLHTLTRLRATTTEINWNWTEIKAYIVPLILTKYVLNKTIKHKIGSRKSPWLRFGRRTSIVIPRE